MINFKLVEISDKKDIDSCLEMNTYRACDFCFTNLFAWNAKFKTHFAIKNQTLFLRFNEVDGGTYYMMPIGKMALNKAFDEIIHDAEQAGIPFQMKGVTARMWEDIEAVIPGKFERTHDRNNDEYIYLTDKLVHLSGKKLQSKRNHINRFKAENSDWQYTPVTTDAEVSECLRMLDEWEEDKTEMTKDKSLRYDHIATQIMLENLKPLDLKAGAIKVNGKIVAFSIGERLVEDTFVVHVEKAYTDMNGAYTIMNQQFAEHETAGFMYVNREDDLGIESLRKAKLSYQPDIMLQEGIIKLR